MSAQTETHDQTETSACATVRHAHAAPSLALLSHVARIGQRGADQELGSRGLRTAHLLLLTLLRDHGETSQAALVDVLRLDPSNVVGLLNDLERRDLIVRRRDQNDRRRHIVALAPAGREELALIERDALHALLLRAVGGQLPSDACTEAARAEPMD